MSGIESIPPLFLWPKPLKLFLLGFLFLLTSGILMGLGYLYHTTTLTPSGAVEHYRGSKDSANDLFKVKEKYPKPVSELLLTTHNHLIGFSFIFIILGGLFYFNSIVIGRLKTFLIVEPFFSTWFTFMSLWGIRYTHESFIYLTMITAILTYLSYFLIVAILFFELVLKKR
jgi:hypothetical protein